MPDAPLNLAGTIEGIRFKSSETGFAILKLKVESGMVAPYCDKHHCIMVLGGLADIGVGTRLSVQGDLVHDKKWGPQIKVSTFTLLEPAGIQEIVRYLTHNVKWVGHVYADKIVSTFGADTLKVLDETPDRLYEIKGIDKKRAEGIKEAWIGLRSLRDLLMFATNVGLGHVFVSKIHKKYGEEALRLIREDPYRLARDIAGIGFIKADEVARKMGVPEVCDVRIRAAARHLLDEHSEGVGDCFVYMNDLVKETWAFLKNQLITPEMTAQVIKDAVKLGIMIEDEGKVYSPDMFTTEVLAAARFHEIVTSPLPYDFTTEKLAAAVAVAIQSTGLELDPIQIEAIQRTLRSKVSVITGGPGTGKTTITRAVVAGYEEMGMTVTLLAPTGRASKRMREIIGKPASTIHRELYSRTKAVKDGDRNIEDVRIGGVVIVDEASMVDIALLKWLLDYLEETVVLVIIGDIDQLPSVGPGSVLRDLIASPSVASTKLTHIFRQAAESDIIRHAHSINNGMVPPICKISRNLVLSRGWPKTDFFLIEQEDQAKQAEAVRWCVTFMASKLGFNPLTDVQVLSPMKRGESGTMNLNAVLQQALNPTPEHFLVRYDKTRWGVGDRLMQIKNNYDYGIFNGDQGNIVGFAKDDTGDVTAMTVNFDGRDVEIDKADFNEMVLAYACTVHKSQGSEYPMVVMCLHTGHFTLLQRNLLYTGGTRTRRVMVLIAHPNALSMAVANNRVARRNTYLSERIASGPEQIRRLQERGRSPVPVAAAEGAAR